MEYISKIWSYIIFVFMILLAVAIFTLKFDVTVENTVTDMTAKFVDECRVTGKINPENFQGYAKKVNSLGNFDIDMRYRSVRSYPNGANGYRRDYYTHNMDEILTTMFPETGNDRSYVMKTGDELLVTVTKNGDNGGKAFLNVLIGINAPETVVVNYSGIIGNSNAE